MQLLRYLCILPLFCLIFTNIDSANAGIKTYDDGEKWAEVDSLINKGLFKSALNIVNSIYEDAKINNNSASQVKSVIYKIGLKSYFEEDFFEKSIEELNNEITTSTFPVTPVLHSILAEIYWRYYQNNRFLFLNRSETLDFEQNDIKTWDLKKIVEKIIFHYLQSLINPDDLKQINIQIYDPVIIKDSTARQFRPTLYDFLAHRAIDFFINTEPDLIKPAYKFELDNEDYFLTPDKFIKLSLNTTDTLSFKFYALSLLQYMEKFHINDENPAALIDLSLKRIKFVKNNSTLDTKDSLFLENLKALEKKYFDNQYSTLISYEIAAEYFRTGKLYNPLVSDDYKYDIKKSYEKCQQSVKRFPASDGAKNCKALIETIEQKSLNLKTEAVETPDKAFRSLVDFKNVDNIFIKIIKIEADEDLKLKEKYSSTDLIKQYLKLNAVKEYNVKLPEDDDMQAHSVEIVMPALPLGYYVILASSSPYFSNDNSPVLYSNIQISNISYISRLLKNYSYDIFVLDRTSGKPIKELKVETFYHNYNYSSRTYEIKKWKTFTSDKNGYVFIPAIDTDNKSSRYLYAEFKKGNDFLKSESYFYQYYNTKDEYDKKYNKTFFFTDRAIYRPGQTIYFKGILLEKEGDKYNIRPNAKTRVALYDVNYQEVSFIELTSNEFGTVSGTFIAPQGGLNGQMYITDTYGYKYFNVEEYKRPGFEVDFNPVKGSYKLGEEVTVTARAIAYAGSNIDGAKVKYRVVRTARFPYWNYWWRGGYPSSPSMEIINGTTLTNEKGELEIKFNAIPDKNIPRKFLPVFNYSVSVDVTDINGETRSSQKTISAGYTALYLNVQMPEKIQKIEKNSFNIITVNHNGEKEPAKGTITIYKLKQPEKTFRQRLWTIPDKYVLSRDEFYKLFPLDLYDDEDNKYKWEKEEQLLTIDFDTQKDSILDATVFKNWNDGQYLLEIKAKDAFGETVENKHYFCLYSPKSKTIPEQTVNWFTILNNKGEPGEKASFIIGTKENDVNVIYEIETQNKISSREFLTLNNEQKFIEIPIKEEYRGNVTVNLVFIKNSRDYYNSFIIYVPYTNKELDIQFETFRNKLLPGQDEEWKIHIKDKKGEKVTAEMLASMYDASLDAFATNYWNFDIMNYFYGKSPWEINTISSKNSDIVYLFTPKYHYLYYNYDKLNWFNFNQFNSYRYYYNSKREIYNMPSEERTLMTAESKGFAQTGTDISSKDMKNLEQTSFIDDSVENFTDKFNVDADKNNTNKTVDFSDVQLRSNFNETAFFLPQLETDENGDIIIKFKVPEALTRWKMMGLAHSKDLKYGMIQKELVTQKDLMIFTNSPRFFREFDKISFNIKISNISDKNLEGEVRLEFFDALNMKSVDELLQNKKNIQKFTVKKGQSTSLNWDIFIPENIDAITYRVVAKADNYSDGEEMTIPVLTNRTLVTESLPLPVNGKQSKKFSFIKLLESEKSLTLRNHKLTLEYTSNPGWYAVQALPYLMEYPYECSEQIFNRYYANSIATYLVNSNPKIKNVFNSWKNLTPDALLSNLEKNQELKTLILEETPWVLDAKNETERKQRISLLFDLTRMSDELQKAERMLIKKQSSNGGWPWFDGMPENRYITQYIITGFGHLIHLGIVNIKENKNLWQMLEKSVKYLDVRIKEDYDYIKKYYPESIDENHLSYDQIQYLYARSYFINDFKMNKNIQEAYDYFIKQAKKYWSANNIYMQGMISLALYRGDNSVTAKEIIRSLKERALHSEELGMYWHDVSSSYYWYQAPVETQSLLIETFDEVANDAESVEEMKIWLLKQKQTQDWKTTKATAEACYALLLKGTDILSGSEQVQISLGNKAVDLDNMMENVKVEAGTGYFKTSWSGSDIKPEMGNITINKKNEGVAWGALYWQYFEQLDKITSAETPLKIDKKLFRQINSATGPKIEPVTEKTLLKIGDKITVRIEIRVDRDMEYVQMKDMRASGFEPVNVISGYKYKNGLGYYESTRDAATNFFFTELRKGTYVFEYPLIVSHKGNFSNGITTIQCMYAPEFSSHSEGTRVTVAE